MDTVPFFHVLDGFFSLLTTIFPRHGGRLVSQLREGRGHAVSIPWNTLSWRTV